MKRLALIAALVAFPAHAQSNCTDTPSAYEQLANRHGEQRLWMGQRGDQLLLEIWVNPETGAWSLLGTVQGELGGMTCLLDQGSGYSATPQGARL